jgi:hypothetical protein
MQRSLGMHLSGEERPRPRVATKPERQVRRGRGEAEERDWKRWSWWKRSE